VSKPCRCITCELFRQRGLKAKFTPQECHSIREWATAAFQQMRDRELQEAQRVKAAA
jgi:hypothetical protein